MLIPKGTSAGELEVKKSRFISQAVAVSSPEEVKHHIARVRSEHPQAHHVVHGYVLGDRGDIFGMSDDHEPKHTAGRPVLEVVKGSGITNVLVLVVRYFGGTKLGTGGLVKAYGESAKLALSNLRTEPLIEKRTCRFIAPYGLYEQAKLLLQKHHGEISDEQFETDVTITAVLPAAQVQELAAELQDLSSGTIVTEEL